MRELEFSTYTELYQKKTFSDWMDSKVLYENSNYRLQFVIDSDLVPIEC